MKIEILNLENHKNLFKDEESYIKFVRNIHEKVEGGALVILAKGEVAIARMESPNEPQS